MGCRAINNTHLTFYRRKSWLSLSFSGKKSFNSIQYMLTEKAEVPQTGLKHSLRGIIKELSTKHGESMMLWATEST